MVECIIVGVIFIAMLWCCRDAVDEDCFLSSEKEMRGEKL